MKKKEEIADQRSCWNMAGDETLMFVGLDWDPAVPAMIRFWAMERVKRGLNRWSDEQIERARALADDIEVNLPQVRALRAKKKLEPLLKAHVAWPFPDKPRSVNGVIHKGCGGQVTEDWTKTYEHEGSKYPAHRCLTCGEEIIGDAQVQIPGEAP